MTLDLSIIIVSWNTRGLLEQCLGSIYAHPVKSTFEVLVVDNLSTDGSQAMVQTRFPQARLIANRENVGFAAGNNQAIRLSQGRIVLLLNPDTEVHPGALDALVTFLNTHPQAGAAGARLLNPDGSLQYSCSPAPTLLREAARLFHLPGFRGDGTYNMGDWDPAQPRPVDVLLGACLALPRAVLDRTGLLDEDYFIYSEEVDLCLRVQRHGWQLYWTPQAEVVHYGGQSTRQAAAEMFLRLYEGKVLYFRKHYGWTAVQAYKAILFAAALGRLALTPLALLKGDARRDEALTVSRHYRRLLAALPRI